MFPKDTGQRKYQYIISALYAAILENGIAALFISTGIFLSRCLFVYSDIFRVSASVPVRFFVPRSGHPRCRSPPSDFDFAHSPKNRNWRTYK